MTKKTTDHLPSPDVTGTILESISDGVFTVDNNWRITFFNRAAEKITGIPRKEALGRPCWEVLRSNMCEAGCALKKTRKEGRPFVSTDTYIINGEMKRIPVTVSTALLKDGHAPAFAFGIVGLFQLIDFCIMGSAVYLTLRYLKYGVPTLVFPRLPLALGEEATILLVVKRHIFPEGGIKAKLKCVTSITTGSGKHRNTVEKVIYECEKAFNEDMADESKGSAIPLVFALPADQPPRDGESTPAILWKLEIAAETPGIDFAASFDDLPVYAVSNRELIETHPDYR